MWVYKSLWWMLAVISEACYIAALPTDHWVTYSQQGFPLLYDDVNALGSISTLTFGISPSTSPCQGINSQNQELQDSICNRITLAEAFTIAAVALQGLAMVIRLTGLYQCAVVHKERFTAGACAVAGVLGFCGWAVWYQGVQQTSDFASFTAQDTAGTSSIGYSQGLDMTAWTLSFVLSGLAMISVESPPLWGRATGASSPTAPMKGNGSPSDAVDNSAGAQAQTKPPKLAASVEHAV